MCLYIPVINFPPCMMILLLWNLAEEFTMTMKRFELVGLECRFFYGSKNLFQFGDSPNCINLAKSENYGVKALVQGYGLTENGTRGQLLETNVTLATNEKCSSQFKTNITTERLVCTYLTLFVHPMIYLKASSGNKHC